VRQLGLCEHLRSAGGGPAASACDSGSFAANGRFLLCLAEFRYLLLFGQGYLDGHGGAAQIFRQEVVSLHAMGRAPPHCGGASPGGDRRGCLSWPILRHRRLRGHRRPMPDRRPHRHRESCSDRTPVRDSPPRLRRDRRAKSAGTAKSTRTRPSAAMASAMPSTPMGRRERLHSLRATSRSAIRLKSAATAPSTAPRSRPPMFAPARSSTTFATSRTTAIWERTAFIPPVS
jgi:hypothetical protein